MTRPQEIAAKPHPSGRKIEAESSPEPRKAGEESVSIKLDAAPVVPVSGTSGQLKALGRYLLKTEVHTYAFSVAAQAILSLFPFIVLLLTLSQRVFHSARMADVVGEMMSNFLPNHQDFVMRNMRVLAFSHARTKIVSIVMLLITATGVFLPLEVALNSVWGVKKNRSYLQNQIVSIALAIGVALLAMASVALTAAQRTVMEWVFFGHTQNVIFAFIGKTFLQIVALIASIALFFLIYWTLPARKIPARAVLPTAIVMGILWTAAKYIYILVLPHLDFRAVYGPFEVSVGLITWAFISGLLLLGGAYVSATRQALRETRQAELKENKQKSEST
ncbi:MAG TPA: YihY/virulence factor BrkB family protein [Acidobacteriaceae bacterium]|nr:YihY/virulence factor BrkB family protein [Acidobacteriaceae bacterium]